MKQSVDELIFVYNAHSGKLNAYLDSLHKAISPSTYSCSLCAITYGLTRIDPKWKAFLKTVPFKTTFLHKDEWEDPGNHKLPAIFKKTDDKIEVFVPSDRLNKMTLEDLMASVERLADTGIS